MLTHAAQVNPYSSMRNSRPRSPASPSINPRCCRPCRALAYAVQHTFANNGYGGAFLTSYVISGCPEPTIPDPIDVIILENLGGDSQIRHVEQVGAGGRCGSTA